MDTHQAWHARAIVERTARALEKNNFTVVTAATTAEAAARLLEMIRPEESVAFGGSATIKELGVEQKLRERGQKLFATVPGMTPEQSLQLRREALLADVYLASPNAVTLDGTLLFVDKIGNRAAGVMFGPKRVIVVAGINKIVPDENAGQQRVDTTAAPVNAKRLGLSTPCAVTGVCSDCVSPQRICNISLVLWKRPAYTDYTVILVPEALGY